MKTLYMTPGTNIVVDTDNNKASQLDSAPQSINRIYMADDDMHLVFDSGEQHIETDVTAGDIIITFYASQFKYRMIVVKSNEWVENITLENERNQKIREEWAAKKLAESCDCESCNPD